MYGVPPTDYDEIEKEEQPKPPESPEPPLPPSYEEEKEHEARLLARHLYEIEKLSSQKADEVEKKVEEPVKVEEPETPKTETPEEANEPEKKELEREIPDARGFPVKVAEIVVSPAEQDQQVVAKVGDKVELDYPVEIDKVQEQAWTQALRNVTLEKWKKRLEAYGHIGGVGMGTALIWQHEDLPKHEARLDLIELGKPTSGLEVKPSEDTGVEVRLSINSPKAGRQSRSKTMTRKELNELHLDPAPFVQKTLGDD